MKYLRYYSDEHWAKLPAEDFRARFFVECYIEKLRAFTPHFYQARLMNIFSACSEMLSYIDELMSNEKNLAYLVSSIKEVETCWTNDIVAQEVLVDLNRFQDVISRAVKSGNIDNVGVHRLRAFCRAVISRGNRYEQALNEALTDAVTGSTDITQKERITDSINKLSGLYVTLLLNQGYSPTYLFNRHEMFTRANKYGGRQFENQFLFVCERLRSHTSDFACHFTVYTNRSKSLLATTAKADIIFYEINHPNLIGIDLGDIVRPGTEPIVAKIVTTSTDHVSAALRSKELLDQLLDVVTAFDSNLDLDVSSSCKVSYQVQALTHHRHVPVDKLLNFMSSEIATKFANPNNSITKALYVLEADSKSQMGRSLRYLRLSKESVSLEQKLLNLWIAFESLFVDLGAGIIGNMLDYVPILYATTGLRRRVEYLRDLLISNGTAIPNEIKDKIINKNKFDKSVTIEQVFTILRDEKLSIALFNSIEKKEHLRFKLMQIFKELETNKALADRLSRTEDDVARQLRRIYFMRNKITHTGRFSGVRPQLITHLLDYIGVCYELIFSASDKAKVNSEYSLIELLTSAKIGAEIVSSKCSSKDRIVTFDQIVVTPTI